MGSIHPAKMFEKLVVIDCRGHLLGRLASFVAKEALAGQKIMLVRAEEINISGSFIRNKLHLLMKKQKRMSTNPKRGPFHHRLPACQGCRRDACSFRQDQEARCSIRTPCDSSSPWPQVLYPWPPCLRDWLEVRRCCCQA